MVWNAIFILTTTQSVLFLKIRVFIFIKFGNANDEHSHMLKVIGCVNDCSQVTICGKYLR